MLASFLITFREGLEAFLLVGIMLSYLERMRAGAYKRYIYWGVAAGLVVSLGLAFVMQVVISQFESDYYQRVLMTGILLFAAGVLSYMAIWMQRQSSGRAGEVREQMARHVDGRNLLGMVSLSFAAVLREGFETVLFFSALTYSGGAAVTVSSGAAGGAMGLGASVALVYALLSGTRRIPLTPFFKYTGLLLIVIAAGLLAYSIDLMQTNTWLPVLVPKVFDIGWLLDDTAGIGLFLRALLGYNASPSLLVFVAWAVHLTVFLSLWRKAYAVRPV